MHGKSIENLYTINSMYADGNIRVVDKDKNEYRLSVQKLLPFVRQMEFEVEKKRTLTHLTPTGLGICKNFKSS